ncbi:sensor histidine kinase [Aneurinibacillus migulanus]|uniref:sensor histidine kinase n=1 Tax=Aneurinibacillus migulanus TaxID=47500 RepID=UPI002E1F3552|nr:sensor histidine kinase [Aneurinibacillus migulanus]
MFIRYVSSMKSWILLFMMLLGFTDLLILLDKGISIKIGSIVYLNVLFLLSFICFFIWRYRKETKYTTALVAITEEMNDDWLETLPRPEYLRDEVTSEVLRTAAIFFRQKLSDCKRAHLIENDYTASWVHEVKAPLTAMKLTIDAHRSDPVMREIEAEWLRIYLLIDRQLYISRLPFLESDYVLEETAIQRLAAKEVRELASWCVENNIAVEFEGEDTKVITDSKWCRFIIRQLLTNAVKYSPDGGTIVISTEIMQTGNVILMIKDEGPGIPAHDLPRIFDKGFTGGNGRLQNAATGLGLYLAQTVAAKIGITLEVQSEPTKGTVMRMMFITQNDFESIRTELLT